MALARRSWGRFVQRRRSVILTTLALVIGGSLLAITLWPATYVARASVAPAGPEYTGPAHRLIARVSSQAVLESIVADAGLVPAEEWGLVARLALPKDPTKRLQPLDHPLVSLSPGEGKPVRELVITTRASSGAAACAAANRIALKLVDLDAQVRGAKPAEAAEDAPQLPQHRVALAALQQRYPLLTDKRRLEAHREAEAAVATEKREVMTLAARLRGYETKAKRLWALVEEEARGAWAAHQAAEAAQLAAKQAKPEPKTPPTTEEAPRPTSTLAQLEEELQRLLTTRTERHPDVRRVRRLLEAERRRVATEKPEPAEPEPEPTPKGGTEPSGGKPVRSPWGAEASPDQAGRRKAQGRQPRRSAEPAAEGITDGAIADDPQAEGPLAAPAAEDEVPTRFVHAAPSYPDWLGARNQVDDTRSLLDGRREALQALTARHEAEGVALQKLLEGLPAAEREQARLQTLIETAQQRAPTRQQTSPLLPGEAARVVEAHRPSRFLPEALVLAVFLSLFLAFLAEKQDPSMHSGSDLQDLAPLLGVVPHLRGRR